MVLSWVGFWLNREATSDRVGLGEKLNDWILTMAMHYITISRHHCRPDSVHHSSWQQDRASKSSLRHSSRLVHRLQFSLLHGLITWVCRGPLFYKGIEILPNLTQCWTFLVPSVRQIWQHFVCLQDLELHIYNLPSQSWYCNRDRWAVARSSPFLLRRMHTPIRITKKPR